MTTLLLSATDVAIADAIRSGGLKLSLEAGRFGPYVAILDEVGLIEVQNTMAEAVERVDTIRGRMS